MPDDERAEESEDELDKLEAHLHDLHDKTAGVVESHRSSLEIDEDMQRKMDEIAFKAKALRGDQTKQEQVRTERREVTAEDSRGLGVGLTAAYSLLGCCAVGIGIGWLVKQATGMQIFVGLGALLGMVIGVVMMIFLVNRANAK